MSYKRVIHEAKLTAYPLNTAHWEGGQKAKSFLSFGFTPDRWEVLAKALHKHATTQHFNEVVETPYGCKYIFEGPIETPSGRGPWLRSVWRHDTKTACLIFVTAYRVRGANDK